MSTKATPRQLVEKLDQYVIGQNDAKRALAVALRNRYRRMQMPQEIREEIVPKNILMIGPTGVGKTELARRLAKLVGAPFVKVEATKFTEVGYVGRDVESMVRDLVDTSVRMVKEEKMLEIQDEARRMANNRLVQLLVPSKKKNSQMKNPFEMLFNNPNQAQPTQDDQEESEVMNERQRISHQLEMGELEDRMVTIEVEEQQSSMFDMLQGSGIEQMGMNMQDAFNQLMPKKKKKRRLPVSEAREVLTQIEAEKLIDLDEINQIAIDQAEQSGIIFIDEIDKVCGKDERQANVSREGVQRDILPIVEGSTVMTKYGAVKTDYMLFITAGAFHMAKPSDLIPELQGRFPIRVELDKLMIEDFINILTEPSNAIIKQYSALLEAEGIELIFKDDAIKRIAEIAFEVNQDTDNIGARRLHTIMERLLEDLSFEAPDINMKVVEITEQYVDDKLSNIVKNRDLSQFIL
ncbi:ATP-dependent protease ATPase subunit HslU [Tenuibacillus multivorans]|uniref:ATP-dependent protease ATPase subunit HslU n=1 Tax=Tenuibacillus multivorans TaxID=237069 RepID=A0A1G9XZH8_9BACI|nr:ATP-dependent protease ATPase subunit HslU [Tenuibacillus multivorans]GEL75886.1 ATP-dependent protease ATPase subunit ClpY [Tenuibacillus multivorans]SDN02187.1 ATP-dependent HslUV protease ATP-binding subunit HslU [Tenuibacillus multivorans]